MLLNNVFCVLKNGIKFVVPPLIAVANDAVVATPDNEPVIPCVIVKLPVMSCTLFARRVNFLSKFVSPPVNTLTLPLVVAVPITKLLPVV